MTQRTRRRLYTAAPVLDAQGVRLKFDSRWRTVLAGAGLVGAVGEALDTISIGWPALIFAGVFAIGLVLLLRGGRLGSIVIGLMMLIEVVAWPSYSRDTATDWIVQTLFLILGVIGVVAAVGELWTSKRRPSNQATA